ncbi:MAG: hypothetical protein KKF65_05055 [Nanoarchaeota archaeon]|nr:hypothetical protein [Nanoarchaeota archaeon]
MKKEKHHIGIYTILAIVVVLGTVLALTGVIKNEGNIGGEARRIPTTTQTINTDWEIGISLDTDNQTIPTYAQIYFGTNKYANDDYDRYDLLSPPAPPGTFWTECVMKKYFNRFQMEEKAFKDIRSPITSGFKNWSLVVKSPKKQDNLTLVWDKTKIPQEYSVILKDKGLSIPGLQVQGEGKEINMKLVNSYEFNYPYTDLERQFSITVKYTKSEVNIKTKIFRR